MPETPKQHTAEVMHPEPYQKIYYVRKNLSLTYYRGFAIVLRVSGSPFSLLAIEMLMLSLLKSHSFQLQALKL